MPKNSHAKLVVMISGTLRDLPDHRKAVMDACLRQDMFPDMMEQLPAKDADAVAASLEMVDGSDIYVGVFGYNNGHVPEGCDISITEMEYNRAVERGIPRLIFLMHKDHPVLISDIEMGPGAAKLEKLKERLKKEHVVNTFRSPEELRANVIDSLSQFRRQADSRYPDVHYVGPIPEPPEPYVAHLYTLQQTRDLVGRAEELRLLDDWVADPGSEVYGARALYVVGIFGTGKSALIWKWFRHSAPRGMRPPAGSLWWSFYESNATFENFVASALAYVTCRTVAEVERDVAAGEREDELFAALDREPFLLVLDGLERLLVGHSRANDPEHLLDETDGGGVAGPDANGAGAARAKPRHRHTADPRAGKFLRKLACLRASRVLVSTRQFPAELETDTGGPVPGCFVYPMSGLSDKDALEFWASLGVRGTPEKLLRFFDTFGKLPLLIQTLAGVVARDKRACGDFDVWFRENRGAADFDKPLKKRVKRILAEALHGLQETERRVLHFLAALYMPVSYSALADLTVAKGVRGRRKHKLFPGEAGLDAALVELEERGLVGWDRRANRYDLHPAIRGAVWGDLNQRARREILLYLLSYFTALCATSRGAKARRLEDLTAGIESYHTLIKLGRFEKAGRVFMASVDKELAFRLGDHRRRAELLELFFTEGLEGEPKHKREGGRAFILGDLATAYLLCGQPGLAIPLYRKELDILWKMEAREPGSKLLGIVICLRKMGIALGHTGALREAEGVFRTALLISRFLGERFHEAICSQWWGILLATRGKVEEAKLALRRAGHSLKGLKRDQSRGLVKLFLAQCELWLGDLDAAARLTEGALRLARKKGYERDLARAARTRGAVALARGARLLKEGRAEEAEARLRAAEKDFEDAVSRARGVTHVREELQALLGLAELKRHRREFDAARVLLDNVLELAECGPYPMSRADAYIMLAQIDSEADPPRAVEAATKAFELSWRDGPPFAYHWGLEQARELLARLGADEPPMPPPDDSQYDPLPKVTNDPPGEPEEDEED